MRIILGDIDFSVFETDLRAALARRLGLPPDALRSMIILRRNVDARQHRNVRFVYRVAVELPEDVHLPAGLKAEPFVETPVAPLPGAHVPDAVPLVVGAGPAGLFAALALCESGISPVIVERGRAVLERAADVDRFWQDGTLDTESNMFFGEGGAGTFSDGKLNTRSKNPVGLKILRELVACGAPEEILYDARPHLGTDRLLRLLPAFRARLENAGATFRFGTRLTGLRQRPDGRLDAQLDGDWTLAYPLILACGHSAFDTYRLLLANGVALGPKGNAFGCRIEHPAEFISERFHGPDRRVWTLLGHAHYNLAVPVGTDGSVYSFCCCPGGEVVACAAVDGQVSVNGMSLARRDSPFTNAGMVTAVGPAELADSPADILAWREQQERACYAAGAVAGPFALPAQRATDFLAGRPSRTLPENSSRRPLVPADLGALLPTFIAERLRLGLRAMDRKIPGWIEQGLLMGVETTTSAPVRILRNSHDFASESCPALLPVGEGSGYAGGIVTSAIDGYLAVASWLEAKRLT
jgi:hypothetical protein